MAFQDYDNDGDVDLLLVNRVTPLALFNNDGKVVFTDVTEEKGISYSLLAYGANWADFDQDGYPDFFLTTMGRNYIFWNREGRYFEIDSMSIGGNEVDYSRGSAAADFDGDGDIDIVVANGPFGSSRILSSSLNQSNYIAVWLEGKKSNRMGIGGQVWLYENGHIGNPDYLRGYRQISTQTGYASSGLPGAYFGVSPEKSYDAVIRFPSGEIVTKPNLPPGKTYTFHEQSMIVRDFSGKLSHLTLSLIYKKNRREMTLRFLLLGLLMLTFGLWLHKSGYWRISQYLFFLGMMVSVYLLISLFMYHILSWKFWFLPAMVTGFLGFGLIHLFTYSLSTRREAETVYHQFDLLRQFEHSGIGMTQINHLLFFANNMGSEGKWESMKKEFFKEVSYFHRHTLGVLKDIFSLGWRNQLFGIPPGEIRKHLNRIRKILNFVETEPLTARQFRQLAESLNLFKKELKSMRHKIEELYTNDLQEMLSEVLASFPHFTEITIINPAHKKIPKIVIRREDFGQVFSNIFRNAIEAMRELPEKKLQIVIDDSEDGKIKVIIQDWGMGIPDNIRDHIFEETFSTKSSSGLGLYHAKKLLRRYGGDIVVLPTGRNEGAKFQLTFREFQHEYS